MSDRVSLLEGKKIFERLVADGVAPVWCNLFNLGNAQSALGEHHAAIVSYPGVLKENPEQVETLKNLGSAYHRAGEHKLEIESFDRALELDPLKWEALVSKAVTLMVDFNQAADAAELLEQALKWHPERAVTWPHVWYWLAEARRRSGNDAGALSALDEGLGHQPGHRAMWRLKSDALQAMATADPERASEAEAFWQARIDIAPLDYGTRERLMRLLLRHAGADDVWRLLAGYLHAVGLRADVTIQDSGFSVENCITAMRFTRQYEVFRRVYPVSDYWAEQDPLYDFDFAPPMTGKIQDALTVFGLVPFGLGFAALEASSGDADVVQRVRRAFDSLRVDLTHAISRASKELAGVVPVAPDSRDDVPIKLAQVLMFIGLVALREFGRQRGWIVSQFPTAHANLILAMDGYDEAKIEKDVAAESLIQLNEALQLFSE